MSARADSRTLAGAAASLRAVADKFDYARQDDGRPGPSGWGMDLRATAARLEAMREDLHDAALAEEIAALREPDTDAAAADAGALA